MNLHPVNLFHFNIILSVRQEKKYMSEIRNDWFLVQQGLTVNKLSTPGFHLMSFLYLQQNYRYSSICDPGMVSQCAKKKLVPQKVA